MRQAYITIPLILKDEKDEELAKFLVAHLESFLEYGRLSEIVGGAHRQPQIQIEEKTL